VSGASVLWSRTKRSMSFKTRHHPVPVMPYRSASLLRHDVTQTHIAGKAYTLPRRHPQHPSPLHSSPTTPPLARTHLVTTSGDGSGLTVWLGNDEEDVNVDDRLSPRCTCTLRRVLTPAVPVPTATAVLRSLTDTPTSFSTFKPSSTSTVVDVVQASPLPRSSVSDCGTLYDRPQQDDTGAGIDYFPQCRDRLAK